MTINQKQAYSDDRNILVLNCLNCSKPLDWINGRRNAYFCGRYCKIKFTQKIRELGLKVKEAIDLILKDRLHIE